MSERQDGRHRVYVNPLIRKQDNVVLFFDCSRCHGQYMRGSPGLWTECAERPDALIWLCGTCVQAVSVEMVPSLNASDVT
jgi:hypothetical protein